ncbi:Transient receptor potential channel pyrexia [Folsomia candida]|uniref:Transient receptor potential channel pyrexia n=1 Tax=Folsomia candida TaxID=158441 RepID=A0A226DSU5_FOLCA|nr:Transient receptor potential channel pyrexia [Folsomia candida]
MDKIVVKVLNTIPLHEAAKRLNATDIAANLENGGDPNLKNSAGNTALHVVLNNEFQGHFDEGKVTDCVTVLLRGGADHRIIGRHNLTPLELAIKNKLHASIKLLLEEGASCVGSLVAELPEVVKDRLDEGISAAKDAKVDKNEKNLNKKMPSESKFLYQVLTADMKNSSIKEEIINHPLVMAYLFLKTARVPKRYYFIQLFELEDKLDAPEEDDPSSTTPPEIELEKCNINVGTVILCYIILTFTLAFGLRDAFLLYRVGVRHLLEWRDWVWRLSLLVNLPVLWPAVVTSDDYELTYNYPLCSIAILLLSLHSLIQMETFKLLSVYVEILVTSMITVVKLMLMFSPVYLGFYMGFNLMFSDVTRVFTYLTMTVDAGSDNFEAIGDEAKQNSFMFELISKAYVLAFIIVMCIGFMNYVLAMSIDDVQRLKKDAKISRAVRQIRNILQVDQRSRSFRLVKGDPTKAESYFYTYKPDADDQELPDEVRLEIVMLLKRKRDG